MDFFNIKSSAALIDEFVQNAGKCRKRESLFTTARSQWTPLCLYDWSVTACRLWQTPGRRTGSSCRPRSPKPSSSRRTSTLWRRWAPASWRTAKPSTSKESWSCTTSAWWLCQSTWSTRWAARFRRCVGAAPVFLVLLGSFVRDSWQVMALSLWSPWNGIFCSSFRHFLIRLAYVQQSDTLASRSSLHWLLEKAYWPRVDMKSILVMVAIVFTLIKFHPTLVPLSLSWQDGERATLSTATWSTLTRRRRPSGWVTHF